MLQPQAFKERGFERLLAATRDGRRERVQRAERDEVELVRVRLVPVLAAARVDDTEHFRECVALVERVAVLRVVLVDVE